MSRPNLARTEIVQFKCTKADKLNYDKQAKIDGCAGYSDWFRKIAHDRMGKVNKPLGSRRS